MVAGLQGGGLTPLLGAATVGGIFTPPGGGGNSPRPPAPPSVVFGLVLPDALDFFCGKQVGEEQQWKFELTVE